MSLIEIAGDIQRKGHLLCPQVADRPSNKIHILAMCNVELLYKPEYCGNIKRHYFVL